MKIKNLEKLFRKNKTSPLLKTQEKDFHISTISKQFQTKITSDQITIHLDTLGRFLR